MTLCIKNPTTSVCEYKAAQVLVTAPIYDQYATNTVKLAAPFDPIPDELRATGVPAGISLRFDYVSVIAR